VNIAFNILAGGQRLEDIELRRQDEVFLNAMGAQRIPDPTTAGDFNRRFDRSDIDILQDCINRARQKVWGCTGVALWMFGRNRDDFPQGAPLIISLTCRGPSGREIERAMEVAGTVTPGRTDFELDDWDQAGMASIWCECSHRLCPSVTEPRQKVQGRDAEKEFKRFGEDIRV
jgi:hypothetical protein